MRAFATNVARSAVCQLGTNGSLLLATGDDLSQSWFHSLAISPLSQQTSEVVGQDPRTGLKYDRPRPYDTRCYFNVRSKADMNQINLPHGNDN